MTTSGSDMRDTILRPLGAGFLTNLGRLAQLDDGRGAKRHGDPLGHRGDAWCSPCRKWVSEHDRCPECQHAECDCICEFLRTEWPTHHANPDRVDVA